MQKLFIPTLVIGTSGGLLTAVVMAEWQELGRTAKAICCVAISAVWSLFAAINCATLMELGYVPTF